LDYSVGKDHLKTFERRLRQGFGGQASKKHVKACSLISRIHLMGSKELPETMCFLFTPFIRFLTVEVL